MKFIAYGYNIGGDYAKMEKYYKPYIQNKREVETLILSCKLELGSIENGTNISHLTATFLKQKILVEKTSRKNTCFKSSNLAEQIILYNAYDT